MKPTPSRLPMPAAPPENLTTVLGRRTASPAAPKPSPAPSRSLLRASYAELQLLGESMVLTAQRGKVVDPRTLVNEAARRSLGASGLQDLRERGGYYAYLANALRRILGELVAQHRGYCGRAPEVRLSLLGSQQSISLGGWLAALAQVERHSERHAQLVVLRVLGGLSNDEAAEQLGITPGRAAISFEQATGWFQRRTEDA